MRMNRKIAVALFSLLLVLPGCRENPVAESPCMTGTGPYNAEKVTISQGLWGTVWFDRYEFSCFPRDVVPIRRQVFIHERTHFSEMEQTSFVGESYYDAIHTRVVAVTTSDETGFFQVQLPPGTYSVFAKVGPYFYANTGDGDGNMAPWEVRADSATHISINISSVPRYPR